MSETIGKLRPQERESLRMRVYDELRRAVLIGHFSPGQRMTIRALAEELGTSPTPVREALGRLHAERVLDLQPSGTAVMPVITRERWEQITVIRVALEGLAAELAATHARAEDIHDLSAMAQKLMTLIDENALSEYLEVHRDFHFRLYRCSGNMLLVEQIEGLWTQCGPVLTYVVPDYVVQRSGSREHQKVMDAIARRDATAAREAIARDISFAAEFISTIANERGEIRRVRPADQLIDQPFEERSRDD